jgi:tetratricopeptide (TPR) repeat protein
MDGEDDSIQTGEEAEKIQGAHRQEDALKEAQECVKQLYWLNTHYFEDHNVESAGKKESDVREKMQQALSTLDSLQDLLPREQFSYLKGKALNVLPEHSPEAERLLASAIKRDPSLADAWVSLGECYWKKGNVQQAHDCFTSSINHIKTKEALRSLSMVLRQMGTNPAEREKKVRESVERAREAVAEDVKDGTSWMILGNAYLSLFFTTSSDPKLLKQSMSAYLQAERSSEAANNPDLHYNKATLCLYEESYGLALSGLTRAAALDPGWSVPRDKMADTRRFLQAMTNAVTSKGKMKSKKSAALFASLSSPEKFTGSFSKTKRTVCISELCEGRNADCVFVGGVSGIVPTTHRVPYACSLVDNAGSSVGLTVYNLADSTHFDIGDVITLPDPDFKHVHLEDDNVEFGSIRCTDPSLLLLNGEKLSADKLASSVVTITTFN